MQNDPQTHANPWVPETEARTSVVAPQGPSWLQRMQRYPHLSWVFPLIAIGVWFIGTQYFHKISSAPAVSQTSLPGFDRFMSVVATISGVFWGLGACMQIALLAGRTHTPGLNRHLLPSLLLSAYCVVAFMSWYGRTSEVIDTYTIPDDFPGRGGGRRPVDPDPYPPLPPPQ